MPGAHLRKEKAGKIVSEKGRGYMEGIWKVCGGYIEDIKQKAFRQLTEGLLLYNKVL